MQCVFTGTAPSVSLLVCRARLAVGACHGHVCSVGTSRENSLRGITTQKSALCFVRGRASSAMHNCTPWRRDLCTMLCTSRVGAPPVHKLFRGLNLHFSPDAETECSERKAVCVSEQEKSSKPMSLGTGRHTGGQELWREKSLCASWISPRACTCRLIPTARSTPVDAGAMTSPALCPKGVGQILQDDTSQTSRPGLSSFLSC